MIVSDDLLDRVREGRIAPVGEVLEVDPEGAVLHARTGGRTGTDAYAADLIVLATGYELAPGAPSAGHQVISTWAMATAPQM